MVGHERYRTMTSKQCDKKTVMYYLCRVPADRNLIPAVCQIEGKKVLDVGLGSGYYTKLLLEKNTVIGIDQNPHLCELPITVHKGDATELAKLIENEKFDVVLSTWMTDYFNIEQLQRFFSEAKAVLNNGGTLITTVVATYGLGFFYIKLAKLLRGVQKYTYSKKQIIERLEKAGFIYIKIVKLNSWFHLPWAYMVVAQ